MSELLSASLAYPTVVYTILLGVTLIYWLFVILGALDIDLLTPDGAAEGAADGVADGVADGIADGVADGVADGIADGIADGVADGVADGIADGVADGIADGVADGVADGAADGMADGATDGVADGAPGGGAGWLSALKLRSAPVTVVASCVVLYGWALSFFGMLYLGPSVGAVLPQWLLGSLVLLVGFVISILLTSVTVRPLAPIFKTENAKKRRDFVGTVCRIQTSEVSERFGQATVEDGGAGLIIQVRAGGEVELARRDRALIIDYDVEREAYVVEPLDAILGDEDDDEDDKAKARR